MMGQAQSCTQSEVESKLGLFRKIWAFLMPTLVTSLPGCWSNIEPFKLRSSSAPSKSVGSILSAGRAGEVLRSHLGQVFVTLRGN